MSTLRERMAAKMARERGVPAVAATVATVAAAPVVGPGSGLHDRLAASVAARLRAERPAAAVREEVPHRSSRGEGVASRPSKRTPS